MEAGDMNNFSWTTYKYCSADCRKKYKSRKDRQDYIRTRKHKEKLNKMLDSHKPKFKDWEITSSTVVYQELIEQARDYAMQRHQEMFMCYVAQYGIEQE
jgi:hypothetical protein